MSGSGDQRHHLEGLSEFLQELKCHLELREGQWASSLIQSKKACESFRLPKILLSFPLYLGGLELVWEGKKSIPFPLRQISNSVSMHRLRIVAADPGLEIFSGEMVRLIMAESFNIISPFKIITKITQQYEHCDILNTHAYSFLFLERGLG